MLKMFEDFILMQQHWTKMFHNIPQPCGPEVSGEEEHRKTVEPEVQDDYRETLSRTQQDSLTYKLKA